MAQPAKKRRKFGPLIEINEAEQIPEGAVVRIAGTTVRLTVDDLFPKKLAASMDKPLRRRIGELIRSKLACTMAPPVAECWPSPKLYALSAIIEPTALELKHNYKNCIISKEKPFKCVCGKGFSLPELALRHARGCRVWREAPNDARLKALTREFTDVSTLVARLPVRARPKPTKQPMPDFLRVFRRATRGFDPYQCIGCGMTFLSVRDREDHDHACPVMTLPAAIRWLRNMLETGALIEDRMRRARSPHADRLLAVMKTALASLDGIYREETGLPLPEAGCDNERLSEPLPDPSVQVTAG